MGWEAYFWVASSIYQESRYIPLVPLAGEDGMVQDKALIDEAVKEALAAVEPTIRAAITKAVEKAGERSRNAIAEAQRALSGVTGESFESMPQAKVVSTNGSKPEQTTKPRANGGYSGVAAAVRRALYHVGRGPGGTGPDAMQKHMKNNGYGPADITVQQIRSSLTQLISSGEAVRIDRGRYRAGDKLPVPN